MKCPNCGSKDLYRTKPTDLCVYCDRCSHSWVTNQTQSPVLQKSIWISKGLRGRHHIDIWLCPTDSTKYSFALRYGASFPVRWNEYSEDPYVKGCFNTPEEAVEAAIDEVDKP